jgi:hypothetical protein
MCCPPLAQIGFFRVGEEQSVNDVDRRSLGQCLCDQAQRRCGDRPAIQSRADCGRAESSSAGQVDGAPTTPSNLLSEPTGMDHDAHGRPSEPASGCPLGPGPPPSAGFIGLRRLSEPLRQSRGPVLTIGPGARPEPPDRRPVTAPLRVGTSGESARATLGLDQPRSNVSVSGVHSTGVFS